MKAHRCRGKLVIATALAAVLALATPAAAVTSTTTVTAAPQSTVANSPVHLQATVSCASDPSGGLGVTFFDGGTLLTTVPVAANGQTDYTAAFAAGTHTITAVYNGNGTCDASNGTTTVEVTSSPTPPGTPFGLCLLACGGLINFTTGDINIHNTIH